MSIDHQKKYLFFAHQCKAAHRIVSTPKVRSLWVLIIFYILPVAFKNTFQQISLRVNNLKCEYLTNPLGIDEPKPGFSWQMIATDTNDRGQIQTAWQIQVASTTGLLNTGKPDIWNSGKIISAGCNNIIYNGTALRSDKKYYWRVKVWDKHNLPSDWSDIAYWRTGLLLPADWKGKWIKDSKPLPGADSMLYGNIPAPLFRKQFPVHKKIKAAVLYVGGLGYFEAYINGKRVTNAMLEPGQTDYSKRIFYSTYDVASVLEQKDNCIGIMCGNGWYNSLPLRMWGRLDLRKALTTGQPAFIVQLNIEFEDGSMASVFSDDSWAVADGPVIRNNVYLGEYYDNRRAIPGWNTTFFNDSAWRTAIVTLPPAERLQSQLQPPVIIKDTLTPISFHRSGDKQIVDFGRNFGGVIRLKVKTTEGRIIRIRYGELLYPDGSLNVMTSTAGQIKKQGIGGPGAPDTAYQQDVFITAGAGIEVFQPRFTYHGFRYAEISGCSTTLGKENIEGLVMHADVPDAGSFTCSDTLINAIQQVCRNTFLSNLFGVQSDCPHREKFGYGGDILATCEALINNFDMSRFYGKTVVDFADAARPDGGLTETAPFVGIADQGLGKHNAGPIEWGTVHPELLYRLYQYYGNKGLVEAQYPIAQKWLSFLKEQAKDHIIDKTIGDHESIDKKDLSVSGTSFYYYNVNLLAYMAGVLGKKEDVAEYHLLAQKIKNAFKERFVDTTSGKVGFATQATQSYALYFKLLPRTLANKALEVLEQEIKVRHKGHIATGMFGTKFITEMLSRYNKADLAYEVVAKSGFPGWEHMLGNGATTIWEHWQFSDDTFSHNHPMFGVVSEWFFRHLAGIRPADDAVGFNKIIIHPKLAKLTFARADYISVLGKVSSDWKIRNGQFYLNVTIPVNAKADLFIPVRSIRDITESGRRLSEVKGITMIKAGGDVVQLKIGSGRYYFVAALQ